MKRKRHSKKNLKIKKRSKKEEKTHTIQAAKDNNIVLAKDNMHEVEAFTNIGNSNDDLTKKRKNELQLEGISVKGTDNQCGLQHAENQTQEQLGLEEIHTEEMGEEYQEIPKEGNSVQVLPYGDSSRDDLQKKKEKIKTYEYQEIPKEGKSVRVLPYGDNSRDDLQKERGENQDLQIDNIISTVNTNILASYGQPDGGIKKKKEKIPSNENLNLDTPDVEPNITETTHMATDHQSADTGLNALCFRLGYEEFIDGWNVGIDGMRVGGKRRLIVPPSMDFGDNALGEDVPPNSWLIHEIDLLSVRI
ncbi:peptidyl-prolyl cis-trans isomerase [Striga asiatica]|uniref:peptidylprolyl isomerase n=1 Tax=Striga asiatica TaxID=4170 RepID=A0A5A7QHQ2_STRAF|nr:peptidyl-prolyl cis-trans isomerase [Striga asiatica]